MSILSRHLQLTEQGKLLLDRLPKLTRARIVGGLVEHATAESDEVLARVEWPEDTPCYCQGVLLTEEWQTLPRPLAVTVGL